MLIPLHKTPGRIRGRRARELATVVAHAIVDDDMAHLAEYFWRLRGDGYAGTSVMGITVLMQHAVVGRFIGFDVSHENGNALDNRRDNLKPRTHSENLLNENDRLRKTNKSGMRWVLKTSAKKKPWRGHITIRGESYRTACFHTPEEALQAVNKLRLASRHEGAARASA